MPIAPIAVVAPRGHQAAGRRPKYAEEAAKQQTGEARNWPSPAVLETLWRPSLRC